MLHHKYYHFGNTVGIIKKNLQFFSNFCVFWKNKAKIGKKNVTAILVIANKNLKAPKRALINPCADIVIVAMIETGTSLLASGEYKMLRAAIYLYIFKLGWLTFVGKGL